jgi:deoxyxylulose-5-phosphate synthase
LFLQHLLDLLQRAYDQIIHDVAIQNLPVIFV